MKRNMITRRGFVVLFDVARCGKLSWWTPAPPARKRYLNTVGGTFLVEGVLQWGLDLVHVVGGMIAYTLWEAILIA